jgi:hypothetical protein
LKNTSALPLDHLAVLASFSADFSEGRPDKSTINVLAFCESRAKKVNP